MMILLVRLRLVPGGTGLAMVGAEPDRLATPRPDLDHNLSKIDKTSRTSLQLVAEPCYRARRE